MSEKIMNNHENSVFLKILPIILLGLNISSVSADDSTSAAQSVANSYNSLGIRVGSFTLSPSVETKGEWNDNIYYRQNAPIGDFIFHVEPSLNLKSNWNRHELSVSSGGDFMFYKNHSTEDKQNYFANLAGRFDVQKDSFAIANFYYQHMAEARGTPDPVVNAAQAPLENDTIGGTAGYEHKINRVRVNVSDDIKHISYIDGVDATGNVVPNSQRSRTVNNATARLGYELFSGYEAYVKGGYNFVDYDNPLAAPIFTANGAPIDRSSHGYGVGAGVKFDLTHTLVGDASLGYRQQTYKSPLLRPISGVSGSFGLTWLPTRLTAVKAGVNRDVMETTQIGLSGFFSTAATASIDHELMRNVLLNAHGGYTNNDYNGTRLINREDDLYNGGLGIKYLLNRYFSMKLNYDYFGRASNINGQDYNINSVYFAVDAKL